MWYCYNFDDKKVIKMIITSKFENYTRDIFQITEITFNFEENQFDKYEIILVIFLVILFIICNIIVLICLLRI